MANGGKTYIGDFRTWLKGFLKPKGLQPTECGFKAKRVQAISPTTGLREQSSDNSKPLRWPFHIKLDAAGALVAEPAYPGMSNIAFQQTAAGNKAALLVRILPVFEVGPNQYAEQNDFEVDAVFAHRDPLEAGGGADQTALDPSTGEMQHRPEKKALVHQAYIFAGLLGIRDRSDTITATVGGQSKTISYGEVVDALEAAIHVVPEGATAGQIPVYDLTDKSALERLRKDIEAAYRKAGPPVPKAVAAAAAEGDDEDDDDVVEFIDPTDIKISEEPTLIGIDPAVYRQINAALNSGKQHIMFYGPPGTGKTTLARWVAISLTGTKWTMITGSADWSSQDIIGGYQPIGDGKIKFFPGVLLRDYDRPVIIDELNRCDIDKVIGPLFTVLSGQETTLPYRIDAEKPESAQFTILPQPKANPQDHEFAPGRAWRLIATINSIDKASLYQMSYALSRRFGWVYVDVPRDPTGFIREYFKNADPTWTPPAAGARCPLGEFWSAINDVREIGPAPIIDAIRAIQVMHSSPDFFAAPTPAMRTALLDSIDMVLLPMLDGIIQREADALTEAAIIAFHLDGDDKTRITERMKSVAV